MPSPCTTWPCCIMLGGFSRGKSAYLRKAMGLYHMAWHVLLKLNTTSTTSTSSTQPSRHDPAAASSPSSSSLLSWSKTAPTSSPSSSSSSSSSWTTGYDLIRLALLNNMAHIDSLLIEYDSMHQRLCWLRHVLGRHQQLQQQQQQRAAMAPNQPNHDAYDNNNNNKSKNKNNETMSFSSPPPMNCYDDHVHSSMHHYQQHYHQQEQEQEQQEQQRIVRHALELNNRAVIELLWWLVWVVCTCSFVRLVEEETALCVCRWGDLSAGRPTN